MCAYDLLGGVIDGINAEGLTIALLADDEVRAALPEDAIREKFDLGYHTKHVDTIFRRVFGTA